MPENEYDARHRPHEVGPSAACRCSTSRNNWGRFLLSALICCCSTALIHYIHNKVLLQFTVGSVNVTREIIRDHQLHQREEGREGERERGVDGGHWTVKIRGHLCDLIETVGDLSWIVLPWCIVFNAVRPTTQYEHTGRTMLCSFRKIFRTHISDIIYYIQKLYILYNTNL